MFLSNSEHEMYLVISARFVHRGFYITCCSDSRKNHTDTDIALLSSSKGLYPINGKEKCQ